MNEARLAAIVLFIADNDGASVARAARQLGLSQSELLRLLVVLGDDDGLGGLGLIAKRVAGSRRLLDITERGRAWLVQHA